MKKSFLNFLLFVLIASVTSCGGYQSISYYNDAIYDYSPQSNKNNNGAVSNSKNNGTYYKDYFSNKALQANQEDILFKNPDDYQNNDSENTDENDYISYGSWGDQISRININFYSSPYRWSYYPYYYGSYPFSRYSSFWGYMYNPWYFPYEYSYYPYYGRSRFSHFYYNPYRSYYWNSLRFTSIYDNPIIYSRLRGARSASSNSINGERTYNPTRSANTGRIVTGNTKDTAIPDLIQAIEPLHHQTAEILMLVVIIVEIIEQMIDLQVTELILETQASIAEAHHRIQALEDQPQVQDLQASQVHQEVILLDVDDEV